MASNWHVRRRLLCCKGFSGFVLVGFVLDFDFDFDLGQNFGHSSTRHLWCDLVTLATVCVCFSVNGWISMAILVARLQLRGDDSTVRYRFGSHGIWALTSTISTSESSTNRADINQSRSCFDRCLSSLLAATRSRLSIAGEFRSPVKACHERGDCLRVWVWV